MSAKKRIGTRRRIDRNKVNEIRKVIQECREADLDHHTTMYREYRRVRDATRLEHAAANYPLFSEDRQIKADVLNEYNKDIQGFNQDVDNPKEQIIAVRHEMEDIHGKRFRMWFLEIAKGQEAKDAADRLDPIIQGLQEKQEILIDVANDKQLERELNAKDREIQKRIDKTKGKKKK